MNQHRKDVIRLIGIYQDFAAGFAADALNARLICLGDADPIDTWAGLTKRSYVVMAKDAAFRAALWSASAREMFDELLERDATGNWQDDM